jgi:Ribosomal protein L13e
MKALANQPIVKRTFRRVTAIRSGRGFSKTELREVGLSNIKFARNQGIRIDVLRKTSHQENIEQLRGLISSLSRSTKSVTGKHTGKKRTEGKEVPSTRKKRREGAKRRGSKEVPSTTK